MKTFKWYIIEPVNSSEYTTILVEEHTQYFSEDERFTVLYTEHDNHTTRMFFRGFFAGLKYLDIEYVALEETLCSVEEIPEEIKSQVSPSGWRF